MTPSEMIDRISAASNKLGSLTRGTSNVPTLWQYQKYLKENNKEFGHKSLHECIISINDDKKD